MDNEDDQVRQDVDGEVAAPRRYQLRRQGVVLTHPGGLEAVQWPTPPQRLRRAAAHVSQSVSGESFLLHLGVQQAAGLGLLGLRDFLCTGMALFSAWALHRRLGMLSSIVQQDWHLAFRQIIPFDLSEFNLYRFLGLDFARYPFRAEEQVLLRGGDVISNFIRDATRATIFTQEQRHPRLAWNLVARAAVTILSNDRTRQIYDSWFMPLAQEWGEAGVDRISSFCGLDFDIDTLQEAGGLA